ncbi:TAM domain methyltransferase [Colletotrichum tabaci]|uniref:TAM domain methyltransferase n=1 Tax=Colletotrichum tabaci TaxID=1209068 RepID=A0AAV9TTP7_9PEZI
MVKLGREYINVPALKTLMEDTGCKELGAWNYENISQAAEALAMNSLTRAFNWSRDDVDLLLINVQQDLKNSNYHAYFPV